MLFQWGFVSPMLSSPTRSSVAGCSTARESGVVNSPLTTAEALLRFVRHNEVLRQRSKASAVPYNRAICQPAPAVPLFNDKIYGSIRSILIVEMSEFDFYRVMV